MPPFILYSDYKTVVDILQLFIFASKRSSLEAHDCSQKEAASLCPVIIELTSGNIYKNVTLTVAAKNCFFSAKNCLC